MQKSSIKNLSDWATSWIAEGCPNTSLPSSAKAPALAVRIYTILSDGDWHTSKAIAAQLDYSPNHIRDIMSALKEPFLLASHRKKGWLLIQKDTAIIV